MANLTLTAANVRPSANAIRHPLRAAAGVAISAGQPIYPDGNGVWQLADADVAAGAADVQAFAGNTAGIGQMVDPIIEDPDFTHGLTGVVAGDTVFTSATAGGLTITAGDLVTGMFISVCMVAKSATKSVLRIVRSGVAK